MNAICRLRAEYRDRIIAAVSDEWQTSMEILEKAKVGKSNVIHVSTVARAEGWEIRELRRQRRQPISQYRKTKDVR